MDDWKGIAMANVLVIDDNLDTCRALCVFLTHAGHRAVHAISVSAAQEMIEEQVPDLIITDLMMPSVSGYDLLRIVRGDARMRQTPVIVFSAVGEAGYVEQAMEAGATEYWLKGCLRGPELGDRLRAYLPPIGWCESPDAHPVSNSPLA